MKTISLISKFVPLLLIFNPIFGQQFYFRTVEKINEIPSSKWYVDFEQFNVYFRTIDIKLHDNKQDHFEIISKIYFDDRYLIGLVINTDDLDLIEITIEGEQIDPFKEDPFPKDTSFVDISQVVKGHIRKKYEKQYKNDLDGLQNKVISLSNDYLRMGGKLDVKIKFKNSDIYLYRIIPEKYGFAWFNKSLPVNVQYSPSVNTDLISNAVSLYYPLQFIKKDLNRKKAVNLTSITNKISFGPYILATIEKNVNFLGGGAMIGLGLSPNGLPIVGGGLAWIKESTKPTFIFTINPLEIGRLIFNYSEIL